MKPFIVASLSTLLLTGAAHAGKITIPDDFPTIQQGVDAAVAGDLVNIRPGSYRENVVVTTSGITIVGAKVVIIDGAYAGPSMSVTADNVKLAAITFSNGGLEYTGTGASIAKCRVRSSADVGLKLTGSGIIDGCTIGTCLGTGVVVATGDPAGPLTTVRNTDVLHCGAGVVASDGPFLVTKCTIANNAGDGLALSFTGTGTPAVTTEVSKNDFTANDGAAILLTDELGAVSEISNNDATENGRGFDLSTTAGALHLNSNDITESHAGGVFLKTAGATFENNHVRRNSLIGIVVLSTGGATDGGNTLNDNMFEANGGDGMHIESGANILDHNYMKDNAGDGLQVAALADGNQLTDNITRNNSHDGLDNWGTNTLITDSKTWDNGGADIAGVGDGNGTVDPASASNSATDLTDLTSVQELELDTLTPQP